jgi:hypothetical protein
MRNWTIVGQQDLNGRNTDGAEPITRSRIESAIASITWQEIPKHGSISLPAMQGEGIKAAIREFRIPKVSHIAYSNDLAPYGLLAIRGHYANGTAEIFIADLGTHLVPVCSDFTSKTETVQAA